MKIDHFGPLIHFSSIIMSRSIWSIETPRNQPSYSDLSLLDLKDHASHAFSRDQGNSSILKSYSLLSSDKKNGSFFSSSVHGFRPFSPKMSDPDTFSRMLLHLSRRQYHYTPGSKPSPRIDLISSVSNQEVFSAKSNNSGPSLRPLQANSATVQTRVKKEMKKEQGLVCAIEPSRFHSFSILEDVLNYQSRIRHHGEGAFFQTLSELTGKPKASLDNRFYRLKNIKPETLAQMTEFALKDPHKAKEFGVRINEDQNDTKASTKIDSRRLTKFNPDWLPELAKSDYSFEYLKKLAGRTDNETYISIDTKESRVVSTAAQSQVKREFEKEISKPKCIGQKSEDSSRCPILSLPSDLSKQSPQVQKIIARRRISERLKTKKKDDPVLLEKAYQILRVQMQRILDIFDVDRKTLVRVLESQAEYDFPDSFAQARSKLILIDK